MLRYLNIQRLALIESLALDFSTGLTVLTGETGAGKSILIDAISLVCGGRASGDLVRAGCEACSVQAIFEGPGNEDVIVRRDVSSAGRGRAFINDTLVTAAALRDRLDAEVELHGQHEQQRLLSPTTHVELLDAYGGHDALRDETASAFRAWRGAHEALDALSMDERQRSARVEWLAFQLAEFDRVSPSQDEEHALRLERQRLMNADRIERLLREAYARLDEDDESVLSRLSGLWKRVDELAALDPAYEDDAAARESVIAPLADLSHRLARSIEALESGADRLEAVEARLAAFERLSRRMGMGIEQALASVAGLRAEHARLVDATGTREALERDVAAARQAYMAAAGRLSSSRAEARLRFSRAIKPHLDELALERAGLDFVMSSTDDESAWTARGRDTVELAFAPNPGEPARPLHRIASGGELSRVMLAIEMLTAVGDRPRTLIFDEVDAGVSGRVAGAVARRLRALAAGHQVLVVSHVAQVAAAAEHHVKVEKAVEQGRTSTRVTCLASGERVDEVARLMAGSQVTDSTRSAAADLIAAFEALASPAGGRLPSSTKAKLKAKAKGESEGRRSRSRGETA